MISHDWPAGIEHCGDLNHLLKIKPFFKNDASRIMEQRVKVFIDTSIDRSSSFGQSFTYKVAQEA